MEKVTAVALLTHVRVVMHTLPHNKVKDLALVFWSVSLPHQDFMSSRLLVSKNILSKHFSM